MKFKINPFQFALIYLFLLGAVFFIGLMLIKFNEIELRMLAEFGDFFGGILNPIIGGLGLGGVVLAMRSEANRQSEISQAQIDVQQRHKNSIDVSSSAVILQIFISALASTRMKPDVDKKVRRQLIEGFDTLPVSELNNLCDINRARWGGAARLLALLANLTKDIP